MVFKWEQALEEEEGLREEPFSFVCKRRPYGRN